MPTVRKYDTECCEVAWIRKLEMWGVALRVRSILAKFNGFSVSAAVKNFSFWKLHFFL